MNIRQATAEDFPQLEELSRIEEFLFADGGFPDSGFFNVFLDGDYFLVAEDEGNILGFILGEPLKHNVGVLWFFTIHEDHRNKGLGKKLFDEFEKRIKNRGVKHILVYSPMSNERSHNFYRRAGFIAGKPQLELLKRL